MQVEIWLRNEKGIKEFGNVIYDEKTKELEVDLDNTIMKNAVSSYLRTEREYWIPTGDGIDEFRVDKAKPTESLMYMELALSSLWGNTGVWVDWETEAA